ncbi:MAG: YtxH domain-containing protein [Deltaproteobacteria bacterium]|nr:YtxH domain-containing protein [Deltaproteobacteria bacterium]
MATNRNAFFAFLLGGVVGAGVALLYAPASGVETRRKIKDGIDDAGDWAKDRYENTRDRVTDGTEKVKQFISDKKEDLQSAIEAGKDAFNKGRERLAGGR